MSKFVVKSGRVARFEGGRRVEYRAGQVVELTEAEARKFAALVAPAPVEERKPVRPVLPPNRRY